MGGRRVVSVLGAVAVAGMAACGPAASPSRVSPGQAGTRATTTVPPGSDGATSVLVAVASSTVAYLFIGSGSGAHLYVTTDAGAHFHEVSRPADGPTGVAPLDLGTMVFPTPTRGYALLGYPWGGSWRLEMTTDGAGTWRRVAWPSVAGNVVALAGHGSRVYAATVHCASPGHCSGVQVWSARSGSADFGRIRAGVPQRESSDGIGLAAWQDSLWVMLGVGSTMNPVTVHSSDAGASFTTRPAPPAVACAPTATSPEVVWTSCSAGLSMVFQRTRLNRTVPLPVTGGGTANTFLQPVSDDVAYFGTSSGDWAGLYETSDAGRHFSKVSAGPPGYTGDATPYVISFLSARVGLAATFQVGLYRTIDGGVSWHPIADPRRTGT